MPVAHPDHLYTLADEILATCIDALSDNGIAPPTKNFISAGTIIDFPDECPDMLAVELTRIYTGLPGIEVALPEKCGHARTAEFLIRIVRCLDSANEENNNPTVDQLNADALATYSDIWVLHQELIERKAAGTFLDACQSLLIGNALPDGPEGGIGGWTIQLDVQIHGV